MLPRSGPKRFGIIALAASAGGLAALSGVLHGLPPDLGVPIVVVQHIAPGFRSRLAALLGHSTWLQVKEAEDGDALTAGTVYVAPPDRHMLVLADLRISLTRTEPVSYVRPSADPLFKTVAAAYAAGAIAVVLTGTGSDGTAGVRAIKQGGGVVIAQNEASSAFFGMPGAAIHSENVDYILPLEEIAPTLIQLVQG